MMFIKISQSREVDISLWEEIVHHAAQTESVLQGRQETPMVKVTLSAPIGDSYLTRRRYLQPLLGTYIPRSETLLDAKDKVRSYLVQSVACLCLLHLNSRGVDSASYPPYNALLETLGLPTTFTVESVKELLYPNG